MEVRGHASNRVRLHDHLLTIVTELRMPERELVLAERQGQVRDWGSSDRLPVDGDFGARRSVQIDPAVRRRHIQRDRLPGLDIQLLPELVSQGEVHDLEVVPAWCDLEPAAGCRSNQPVVFEDLHVDWRGHLDTARRLLPGFRGGSFR